jgi:ATPase subunit of ABC transporter with duplicated ATPase domains
LISRFDTQELQAIVDELSTFEQHLIAVAHDVYFAMVRVATET